MKQISHREFGFAVIVLGVLIEIIGLSLDAFLHSIDETLAAREGVFTLSNPGHLLFIAGLALTILGIGISIASRLHVPRQVSALILIALITAATLGVSKIDFAFPTHSDLHDDHSASSVRTISDHKEIQVSWEQLREIDRLLGEVRDATDKYRDVKVALADGYQQASPSRSGEGAHFVNGKILDAGLFDVTHPTFLMYERKPNWDFELVGVGWMLPKQIGNTKPPPYFAPLAAWHFHDYAPPGICFWENGTTDHYPEASCAAEGGRFWRTSPWMLHVWIFRPSPDGVFSLVNSAVDGIQVDDDFSN